MSQQDMWGSDPLKQNSTVMPRPSDEGIVLLLVVAVVLATAAVTATAQE